MATLEELSTMIGTAPYNELRNKVNRAIIIESTSMVEGTPTVDEKAFALAALSDPKAYENTILEYLVGDNNLASVSGITSASDDTIKTSVVNAITKLYL